MDLPPSESLILAANFPGELEPGPRYTLANNRQGITYIVIFCTL